MQRKYTALNYRVLRTKKLTARQRRIRRRRRRAIKVWGARIAFVVVMALIIYVIAKTLSVFMHSQAQSDDLNSYETIAVSSSAIVVQADSLSETEKNIEQVERITDEIQEVQEVQEVQEEEAIEELEEIVARISPYEAGCVYYYQLTYDEKIAIAKEVFAEAGNQCFEGKVAVAAVILNRYYSDDPFFQNESIYSILSQQYQFADTDWITDEILAANPSCLEAVEQACLGWDPTRKKFPEGACYFFEPEGVEGYQKEIRTGIEVLVIGDHHFHNDFAVPED